MPTNREIIEAYATAMTADLDTVEALRHPDFVEDWPQSGERVRGPANMRAIDEHYPGNLPRNTQRGIVGSEDRWVMTPTYSPLRIEGTGDVYTCVWEAIYPDQKRWHVVSIVELKDQRVWRQRTFFAESFEPPAWRAAWVERIPEGE